MSDETKTCGHWAPPDYPANDPQTALARLREARDCERRAALQQEMRLRSYLAGSAAMILRLRRDLTEALVEAERLRAIASAKEAPMGYYTTEARVVGVQTRPWMDDGRTSAGVEAEITIRSVLSGALPGRERVFPPVYHRVLVLTTFEEEPT